jgi:hypothetical protein
MFTRKPRLQPGKFLNSGAKDFCNTIGTCPTIGDDAPEVRLLGQFRKSRDIFESRIGSTVQ